MTYVESYINQISNDEIKNTVLKTIKNVVPKYIQKFSFREHVTGLLLGNVQSGKTGQMFGLISAAADAGFKLFVLLTTTKVLSISEQGKCTVFSSTTAPPSIFIALLAFCISSELIEDL